MEVFFYGLFMDFSILLENGITPTNPRKGYLKDYALIIGKRASLTPSKNEKSYGIVITVDKDAIKKLYAEPSVADYIPEEVSVITNSGIIIKSVCYNLPKELLSGTNPLYAESLYKLGNEKGLPKNYLKKIREFI